MIVLAGSKDAGRNFVYWTEVKKIPSTDLATIERLWNQFSNGKFGYTVQKVRLLVYFGILKFSTMCIDYPSRSTQADCDWGSLNFPSHLLYDPLEIHA